MMSADEALRLLDARLRDTDYFPYYLAHRARYRSDALRVLREPKGRHHWPRRCKHKHAQSG